MRKMAIAGNWKMHKTREDARLLAGEVRKNLADISRCDVILCPTFTVLCDVFQEIKGSNILLGAQDVHFENAGAFTGEVSPAMLLDAGCKFVIVGHSERRTYFGETTDIVNKKVKSALKGGLTPIMCVGETGEERKKGITEEVVRSHIVEGLKGVSSSSASTIIIAYEPVWAIGTGVTATPKQAAEVHTFIRRQLTELYGVEPASLMRIQYGGSVKPDNISELTENPDIDGALVGGASLDADSFTKIVLNALETRGMKVNLKDR